MIINNVIKFIKAVFNKNADNSGSIITCAGCVNLWYNCCGQAECLENRDKYCPQSGFIYRSEKQDEG